MKLLGYNIAQEKQKVVYVFLSTLQKNNGCLYTRLLTLFRLGFFGQSVTWGGGKGLLGPPLCISGTNNARVMKFTHNDHLRTKKPNTQF